MNTRAALRCKAGELAFVTGSRRNAGKIVLVRERDQDFEGRPTWLVIAQGAPLLVRMDSGNQESKVEWWAVDAVLTPIRPGGEGAAGHTAKGKRPTVEA